GLSKKRNGPRWPLPGAVPKHQEREDEPMPYREDVLRDETSKDQCDDDSHRIFYTLDGAKGFEKNRDGMTPERLDQKPHRLNKAVTGLAVLLLQRGVMTQDDLDEWLLSLIG